MNELLNLARIIAAQPVNGVDDLQSGPAQRRVQRRGGGDGSEGYDLLVKDVVVVRPQGILGRAERVG